MTPSYGDGAMLLSAGRRAGSIAFSGIAGTGTGMVAFAIAPCESAQTARSKPASAWARAWVASRWFFAIMGSVWASDTNASISEVSTSRRSTAMGSAKPRSFFQIVSRMDIPLSLVVWRCPTQARAPESIGKRRARRPPSPRICSSVLRLRERLTRATGRHRRRETDSRGAENTSAPELLDEVAHLRANGRLTATVDDPVIAIGRSAAAVRSHAQVPEHLDCGHGVSGIDGSHDVGHAGLERSPESEVAERYIGHGVDHV